VRGRSDCLRFITMARELAQRSRVQQVKGSPTLKELCLKGARVKAALLCRVDERVSDTKTNKAKLLAGYPWYLHCSPRHCYTYSVLPATQFQLEQDFHAGKLIFDSFFPECLTLLDGNRAAKTNSLLHLYLCQPQNETC
jgi:hypothetical protein